MKSILYDKSEAVAALNRVEGFNPVELARRLEKEGQEDQLYLDVKYRKLWFRLVYPMGKIISIVRSFSENAALVEARIYLDKCDAEDNFIANAFSQKFRSEDPNFGAKFLELAETAAVGRALSDAGFGLQFADVGEENDPEQVDAGIQIPQSSQNSGTVQSPYSGNRADYQSTENTYQQPERQMTGGSIPPMQLQVWHDGTVLPTGTGKWLHHRSAIHAKYLWPAAGNEFHGDRYSGNCARRFPTGRRTSAAYDL